MHPATVLPSPLRQRAQKLLKRADTVGADVPFEQAFSALGHAVLQDKAPGLLDYEIGFQVVDKNEDNTKAMGVFGFKVGPVWLYAPIFFIEGDIKGQTLLYIRDQDLFVPLKENWLNYLIGRKPYILGKSISRDLARHGVLAPNFYQFSRSPAKFAMDESDWLSGGLPALADAAVRAPDLGQKTGHLDLPTFLRQGGQKIARAFVGMVRTYPWLMDRLDRFYSKEALDQALHEANNQPLPEWQPQTPTTAKMAELGQAPYQVANTPPLFRLTTEHPYTYTSVLSPAERTQLIQDGQLLLDKRSDEQVTRAYDVVEPENLRTPNESGLYSVLTGPDTFSDCAVFLTPYTHAGHRPQALVVRLSDRTWLFTDPSRIWTESQKTRTEFREWVDGLPEAKGSRQAQVLVSPSGVQASLPVYSLDRRGDGAFEALFVGSPAVRTPVSQSDSKYWRDKAKPDPFSRLATKCQGKVVMTGARGVYFRAAGDALYIPAGSKSLALHDGYCSCGSDSEPPPLLELANLVDLRMGIRRQRMKAGLKGLKVAKTASGWRVGEFDAPSDLQAVSELVLRHGLREKVARALLGRVSRRGESTEVELLYPEGGEYPDIRSGLHKEAGPPYFLQRGGPNSPPIPENWAGPDPVMGGLVQSLPPMALNIPATDVYGRNYTDRGSHKPWPASQPNMIGGDNDGPPQPDQQSLGLADRAAQRGQKEVFDTAMIGAVVKRTKVESILDDKILASSMECMNQYGRALAHLYYNRPAWEERFGKSEVPELEDLLTDTFESLGDTVLRLREGTVEPGADEGVLPDMQGRLE